ncbi:MAG TPA: NAD(P)/FAD-dependent oxidoreductase [Methylocystis sp.]|nr:NAD(P)/FAD-dependent oxidoreductase [Methylocystis sp.]
MNTAPLASRGAMMERVEVDNLVVGAGVIGLAIGAEFARRGRSIFVIEAGPNFGQGISSRNSEVIHSGIYYPTGSLKHLFCVEGRRRLYAYCQNHGVAYRKCGKLVAAFDDAESEGLATLAGRAEQNHVENVEIVDGATARRMEPALRAASALHVKETGIIDSHGLMLSLLGEIEDGGGALLPNHRAVGGRLAGGSRYEVRVESPSGLLAITTANLIIAAGMWTNALAARFEGMSSLGAPPLFLAKGSYFALSGPSPFTRLIYPLPMRGGLGVHLTLTLDGRARFGPDVEWLVSNNPEQTDFGVDPARAQDFYASVRRYWPELPDGALIPDYAGVRPKLAGPNAPAADFRLSGPQEHGFSGLLVLYGMESPGLTSALAVGARVADMLAT